MNHDVLIALARDYAQREGIISSDFRGVRDHGTYWSVYFNFPEEEGSFVCGDRWVVRIDKKTHAILSSMGY